MMRTSFFLCVSLLLATACGTDSFAENELILMAQAWSGSDRLPLCGRAGPDGVDLGSPDARFCDWYPSDIAKRQTRTAISRPQGTSVSWLRATTGAADADRLTDSIRTALLARGLIERSCGSVTNLSGESRGVRWESDHLVLDVTRITPHIGLPRIQIVAVDVPSEMPGIICARTQAP